MIYMSDALSDGGSYDDVKGSSLPSKNIGSDGADLKRTSISTV